MHGLLDKGTGAAARFTGDASAAEPVRVGALSAENPRPLSDAEKTVLAPYIPGRDLDGARLHIGEMPFFAPSWANGITLGNQIYFRNPQQTFVAAADVALLGHELVHVGQFADGMTVLAYLWASRNGYANNPYEIAAYAVQRKIEAALGA